MVDASFPPRVDDPERALALTYAAPEHRAGLAALLALDDRLGEIVRTTREPLVGQMRLTWWHDALTALDDAPAPAEPILQALAASVIGPVRGTDVAVSIEGWELLLEPDVDAAMLQSYAEARGGALFAAMGLVVGVGDADVRRAGEGWALADLSTRLANGAVAQRARSAALARAANLAGHQWPRPVRAIGALARSAMLDLADPPRPAGHPARVARLMWLRLSGR